MHKSRLSTFVIDCQTTDVDEAARFWSAALGREVRPAEPGDTLYRELATARAEPQLLVQKVDHPGRIHLDIETDDQEAEVRRLQALGAKLIGRVKGWFVLEAPTGQRFCVVREQRGPLRDDPSAKTWE